MSTEEYDMEGERIRTLPGLWSHSEERCMSAVIPGKVDRITPHVFISVDVFLAELMGAYSGMSCEKFFSTSTHNSLILSLTLH